MFRLIRIVPYAAVTPSLDFEVSPCITDAAETSDDIRFGESASSSNLPPCISDIRKGGSDIVVGESVPSGCDVHQGGKDTARRQTPSFTVDGEARSPRHRKQTVVQKTKIHDAQDASDRRSQMCDQIRAPKASLRGRPKMGDTEMISRLRRLIRRKNLSTFREKKSGISTAKGAILRNGEMIGMRMRRKMGNNAFSPDHLDIIVSIRT